MANHELNMDTSFLLAGGKEVFLLESGGLIMSTEVQNHEKLGIKQIRRMKT